MENSKSSMILGIFLIVVGIVFLIGNLSRIGMETLWPVFPLAVGFAFWVGYFRDRANVGFLMPGAILVIISLMFFYCNLFGWWRMEILWPIFILAPAVGFVSMYFGGKKEQGLLIPAGVLGGVAIVFLLISSGFGDYWPVFLIIAGILMILLKRIPGKSDDETEKS